MANAVFRLNPAQREAVEHGDGPLLVLAGAGSGKTRVITQRIVRLVERGVPERTIVALTFTNKAAGEMRERVTALLGSGRSGSGSRQGSRQASRGRGDMAGGPVISTFHSFGLSVLDHEKEALGGRFTIFDQGDQTSLVKQLLRETGADRAYDAQAVIARISNAKNANTPVDASRPARPAKQPTKRENRRDVRRDAKGDPYDESRRAPAEPDDADYDAVAAQIYPLYQSALRRYRAFDFDDLVCEPVRLWRERADVLARWQGRFLHVLVDEYQDTNGVQLEMLRLLCGARKNICAVGDDDQSIYGWRGADVRNILDFERHFAGAHVVKLEQNYRSRTPILAVANAVIARRADAKWRKTLFTDKAGGAIVEHAIAPSPEDEAGWVAREIRTAIRDEGKRPSDVAVLYRSNGQSRLLEEALRENGVSHRVVGGMQFFERKEVKDILAYLKLALNLVDEISLRRVVNYPPRGIGEVTLDKLVSHAHSRGWTLWQAIDRCEAFDDIPQAARDGCRALSTAINDARKDLLGGQKPPSEVARALYDGVAMKGDLEVNAGSNTASAKRQANVEGVLGTLTRREAKVGNGLNGLSAFLQMLTLDLGEEEDESADVVTLSTLHGSKGLEFDMVFLVGCEEGYLPHARTIDTRVTDAREAGSDDIEEERRLFYVGVTRARERLVLSRAKSRVLRGKPVPRTPSRFLLDVPGELLAAREVKGDAPTSAKEAAANVEAILALLR